MSIIDQVQDKLSKAQRRQRSKNPDDATDEKKPEDLQQQQQQKLELNHIKWIKPEYHRNGSRDANEVNLIN